MSRQKGTMNRMWKKKRLGLSEPGNHEWYKASSLLFWPYAKAGPYSSHKGTNRLFRHPSLTKSLVGYTIYVSTGVDPHSVLECIKEGLSSETNHTKGHLTVGCSTIAWGVRACCWGVVSVALGQRTGRAESGGGQDGNKQRELLSQQHSVNTICLFIFNYVYVRAWVYGHRYLWKPKASIWKCMQETELRSSASTVYTDEPSSLQPPPTVSKASSGFSPPGSFISLL